MVPPSPLVSSPQLMHWLKISEEKELIFFTGRVELGQGNTTALLIMIADELDILPSSIILETARTDLTPNEGITAGSMSITIGGQALRWVASALRLQLLEIVSRRWNVNFKDLSICEGYIYNRGKKTRFSLADFFDGLDLTRKIVDDAKPKTFKERWKSFRDINRIDLESCLSGAPFIHDLKFDGMLYGAPVHPPSTYSHLVDLDLEMLKGRPGVIKVVRHGSFVGIIASTSYHAKNAVSWARNNGKWESSIKKPFNLTESLKNSNIKPETVIDSRDVNKNSGTWFEITVSRPFIYHGSIGPAAAIARVEKDKITVFSHSQGVFQLRQAIAKVLNISEEKICIIHKPSSGCYGHNGADDVTFDAVLMAKSVPGRFLKVVWSRFDEFHSSPMGASMLTKSRALLSSNNQIVAFDVEVNSTPHTNRPSANFPNLRAAGYLADPIPPSRTPDVPVERGGGADRNAIPSYEVGGVRVRKRIIYDTPYRTSALRSLGAYCNVVANEVLLDSIAKQIGAEPITFRLDHTTDPRAREILERMDCETKKDREKPNQEGIGWGIGFARYKGSGGYCAVMVKVHVGENVRVTDAISVSDVGEAVSLDGVKNQVEGGIIQSISWTLKESVPVDGFSTTAQSWTDYPILKFSEIPTLRTILIERPEKKPLGAGEISQGPTGAAIVNAVADAIGCNVTNLPVTRDAIISAINAKD